MHLRPLLTLVLVVCTLQVGSAEELYREPLRPQFHFTAARNWLNDPNGLVYYAGEYHLFFQHNPSGIDWGNMTWGHAVSTDLLHWRQLDNALLPDRLGTIFSGSAVVDHENSAGFQTGDEKTLIALYTAAGGTSPESKGQPFTQCLAYSNDRGRTWKKYERNPVLTHIRKENRDPKVVWHAPSRRWIMALYLDESDFALFASPDLKTWTHLQDITMPGHSECPDFFEMQVEGAPGETRWILTAADGYYLVGRFDGRMFTPEAGPLQADWGANYYAVQTYSDAPAGRRIQIAWMRGGKYPGMPFNQQMSIPCELKLRRGPDGLRIARTPVEEVGRLRGRLRSWANLTVNEGENPLAGLSGDLFDIVIEFRPESAQRISLTVRGEPITYVPAEKKLTCMGHSAEIEAVEGVINLRILVDRTSIELFANEGRVAMTSFFLPRPETPSLALAIEGDPVTFRTLAVDDLTSVWDRPAGSTGTYPH